MISMAKKTKFFWWMLFLHFFSLNFVFTIKDTTELSLTNSTVINAIFRPRFNAIQAVKMFTRIDKCIVFLMKLCKTERTSLLQISIEKFNWFISFKLDQVMNETWSRRIQRAAWNRFFCLLKIALFNILVWLLNRIFHFRSHWTVDFIIFIRIIIIINRGIVRIKATKFWPKTLLRGVHERRILFFLTENLRQKPFLWVEFS